MGEFPPLSRDGREQYIVDLVTSQVPALGEDPAEQIAFLKPGAQQSVQLPQLRDSLLEASEQHVTETRLRAQRIRGLITAGVIMTAIIALSYVESAKPTEQ